MGGLEASLNIGLLRKSILTAYQSGDERRQGKGRILTPAKGQNDSSRVLIHPFFGLGWMSGSVETGRERPSEVLIAI